MEADLVDKLDEACRRQGLRSRTDLVRKALRTFMEGAAEAEVAAMVAAG